MNIMVSIIMPAFNASKYIEESIVSAQNQTYTDWELIVVDDGSTDNTAKIVHSLKASDPRINYIYQSNKRLGAARNTGLRFAKGKFIAFLDSDDLWMPEKLEKQLSVFNNHNVDLVYTNGYKLMETTQTVENYPTKSGTYTGTQMYQMQYIGNHIPVLSVLMKREWINKIGLHDENIHIFGCEDYDYWIRMAKNGANFYGMDEYLFKYRVHPQAMSQNHTKMKVAELTVLVKNFDFGLRETGLFAERISPSIKSIIPKLLDQKNTSAAQSMALALWKLHHKPQYLLLWLHIWLFKDGLKSIFYVLLLKK